MDPLPPSTTPPTAKPPIINYILSFLLVGIAWGLTTPFMRKAALHHVPTAHPSATDPRNSWLKRKVLGVWFAVTDLLRRPAYAVPLLVNVTGSVWFFLLIGQAELSLTVPITNSLAFLFTVLGEWWAEGKMIKGYTWLGMGLVLGGITLCVSSKTQ